MGGKKRKINDGLKRYNIIRSDLAAKSKEYGLNLGKKLNSQASLLYKKAKSESIPKEAYGDLVNSYFEQADWEIEWFNLTRNIESNLIDGDVISIDSSVIGYPEIVLTSEIVKSKAFHPEYTKPLYKEIRPLADNTSGKVAFAARRRGNLLEYELLVIVGRKLGSGAGVLPEVDPEEEGGRPRRGRIMGADPESGSSEVQITRLKIIEAKMIAIDKKIDKLGDRLDKGTIKEETWERMVNKLEDESSELRKQL
jgi:hypothetical protein